jgi:hypothetical protein
MSQKSQKIATYTMQRANKNYMLKMHHEREIFSYVINLGSIWLSGHSTAKWPTKYTEICYQLRV